MQSTLRLPIQIVVTAVLLLFYSCQSSKQISIKYTNKALKADSIEPVRIISALHPCITQDLIKGDSTAQQEYFRKLDSVINMYHPSQYVHDTLKIHEQDCIDLVRDYNKLVDDYVDQANYVYTLKAELKVKPPIIVDTVTIADTKLVYVLEQTNKKLIEENVANKAKLLIQKNTISELRLKKLHIILAFIGLSVLVAIGLYFTMRRKL